MAINILVLKSSPRPQGNSNFLADQAADGARQAGGQVEVVSLHGLDIRPCDGCDFCVETGVCVLKDDMQTIYPSLLKADALLLSSPIYWFTYTAQLKLCIDRWYGVWNYRKDFLKGKPVGVILSYGDDDLYSSGAVNAIHTFESMLRYLKADFAGIVHGTLSEVGDAAKHPELLAKARKLGELLAG